MLGSNSQITGWERKRERELLEVGIDFGGRERNAAARQARGPIAAASEAISLTLKSLSKKAAERDRERERERGLHRF